MPDRIDNIIARVVELEAKVATLLSEEEYSLEATETKLSVMDIDQRIRVLVPKIVEDEVEGIMAKNETLTRAIVMSALQEGLTPQASTSDDPIDTDPTVIPKRKPASKRTKAKKE